MTLTLTIEGGETLDNGQPGRLELDRHGAVIGRSPHADWSLPDTRNLISSRHCEISYRDDQYLLIDHSTNGTYLNGSSDRLRAAHALAHGDRFTIGHYAIVASQREGTQAPAGAPAATGEDRWESFQVAHPHRDAATEDDGWAEPPEPSGDLGGRAARSAPEPAAVSSAGTWDLPAPVSRPSAWSSEAPRATAPTADDVWGRLSEQSEIDWSRGNFASIAPAHDDWAPVRPVVETGPDDAAATGPHEAGLADPAAAPEAPAPEPAGHLPLPAGDDWARFVDASGLPADRLRRSPGEALVAAGAILRQMVGGLMLMIEARARAKAQLGVQATGLELDGNNPLKFVRSPERALLQLLDAPERGFMPAERAVEDAYQDLQAHQMATLSAMRGALEGTLARFSPTAIRERAAEPGWLTRHFSVLQRARHWDDYERDFEGVVRGADEAFMDLFAREFRLSYDRHIGEMKAQRRQGGSG